MNLNSNVENEHKLSGCVEQTNVEGEMEETDLPPPKKLRKAAEDESDSFDEDTETESDDVLVVEEVAHISRHFRRIPIFIVDYHNDVLEFIWRCLGTRHLPLTGNTLLHFDSHPDMVISQELPASAAYDKEIMLSELSIENWIMPACYAGQFQRVIWLKNYWCRQLPLGEYRFKVGQRPNDKRIAVDLPLDYFIAEGSYCTGAELEAARDMELQVHNMGGAEGEEDVIPNPKQLLSKADEGRLILDIDLDYFSTTNPFLEIYKKAHCYDHLTRIFYYESAEGEGVDCSASTAQRREQLDALRQVFEHLEDKRSLIDFEVPAAINAETWSLIEALTNSLKEHYADDEIDWLLVYDSGSTTDSDGLPHHVSTEEELELYYARFKRFLEELPVPPVIITIACSSEDDYCPKLQVEEIRKRVLLVIQEVFGERVHAEPIRYDLDDDWNVWQL